MTSTSPDLVVSGVPYVVLAVGGHAPRAVADFDGPAEFTFEGATGQYLVVGEGEVSATEARVHEKAGAGGKDVRVWNVRRDDDGAFVATAE
jgi:hypothetical protein